MDHIIRIFPWQSRRPALAAQLDWSCSCGRRASGPSPDRASADANALRHTPRTNTITRHDHTR